jgi:Domain of unknown function (DU1801)
MASPTPASDVRSFLSTLPPDRKREIERVRRVLTASMPTGYEEVVSKDMLVYQVPLSVYPDTYNKQPLWYVALASQKHYMSLYLMSAYGDDGVLRDLKAGFDAAGKTLDMGKSCVRFQAADDLPLEVIGRIVARLPVERWVAIAKAARQR